MWLVRDHHEGIISRDTFNAVQAEFARRNAGRAPNRKIAPTGRSCYSAKYALTEWLVCGECGTLYRRCVWSKGGRKRAVWRCASLLEQQDSRSVAGQRIRGALDILRDGSGEFTEWDESIIRQLVDTVKVVSAEKIVVHLRDRVKIEQLINR